MFDHFRGQLPHPLPPPAPPPMQNKKRKWTFSLRPRRRKHYDIERYIEQFLHESVSLSNGFYLPYSNVALNKRIYIPWQVLWEFGGKRGTSGQKGLRFFLPLLIFSFFTLLFQEPPPERGVAHHTNSSYCYLNRSEGRASKWNNSIKPYNQRLHQKDKKDARCALSWALCAFAKMVILIYCHCRAG